jgi:hypothetical protein
MCREVPGSVGAAAWKVVWRLHTRLKSTGANAVSPHAVSKCCLTKTILEQSRGICYAIINQSINQSNVFIKNCQRPQPPQS